MERKIIIQNFGPIKTAEIDLDKNFQVFIGEQASGKSTIGKFEDRRVAVGGERHGVG